MKEYIERAAALDILDVAGVMDEAYNAVKDLPAADVVEVVRCKNCRYHKPIDYCEKHKETGWFPDDFCSHGASNAQRRNKDEHR